MNGFLCAGSIPVMGAARLGVAGHGGARLGMARPGKARHGIEGSEWL